MKAGREEFSQAADALARSVAGGRVDAWKPRFGLTKTAYWYTTETGRLVAVVGDHERRKDIDGALGFLLGVMGNGTADLVLPHGREATTLRRIAFLTYPIRVWTHRDGEVQETIVPSRSEVMFHYDDSLVLDVHDLGEWSQLVTDLVVWAEEHPQLEMAHRQSYLSWHHQGRKVLQIKRTRSGLRLWAGSQFKAGQSIQIDVRLEPLAPDQEESLKAAVEQAVSDRQSRLDDANREHRFQAALASSAAALGYRAMHREFPAKRAGRGFIDFLAITVTDQLVVVETKSGASDRQFGLQGLDYWIWATAHRGELATTIGADPEKPVRIDYVVDSSVRPVVSPYTAAQVEALDGSIQWRFRAVEWEDTGDPRIVDLPLRWPPGPDDGEPFNARRLTAPRYRWEIGRHLVRNAPGPVTRGVFLKDPMDGVVEAAKHVWLDLEQRGLVHAFGNHLRSSQVFGVNLFGPLSQSDAATLLNRWFSNVSSFELPAFEWSDPLDRLGEKSGELDHQTQVDVLLRGTEASGRRIAALVEVKFTEDGYGPCAAYQSAPEPNRAVCRQAGPFGQDPQHCWAINNRGTGGRRRYDVLLGEAASFDGAGCWYRTAGYQPMRNLALAAAMLQDREIEEAVFVVCAPRARVDLRVDLARISTSLPGVSIGWLNAEDVLSLHRHSDAAQLSLRYDLRPE